MPSTSGVGMWYSNLCRRYSSNQLKTSNCEGTLLKNACPLLEAALFLKQHSLLFYADHFAVCINTSEAAAEARVPFPPPYQGLTVPLHLQPYVNGVVGAILHVKVKGENTYTLKWNIHVPKNFFQGFHAIFKGVFMPWRWEACQDPVGMTWAVIKKK